MNNRAEVTAYFRKVQKDLAKSRKRGAVSPETARVLKELAKHFRKMARESRKLNKQQPYLAAERGRTYDCAAEIVKERSEGKLL